MVASASLALVNSLTKPKIIAQCLAEEQASLKEVFLEAQKFEAVKSGDEILYYKAFAQDNEFLGVVFKASGKGYSSSIETMVGMKKDGVIVAIKVLSQNETPGLGTRVTEPFFSSQFLGKNTEVLLDVQAISGATISSKAVIESVKKKAEEIKELMANGK
jgi:electron transport complex protein RnfG